MKVAIMGAGLSGLSCAIVLEKYGITPHIFEDRGEVGDRFVNGEALFNIFNRPINNCMDFFRDNYEINLEPLNEIKKINFHSVNEKTKIETYLGVINIRGRHNNSFEKQLYSQLKSKINFNSKYTYEQLKKEYSHVVLATGDAAYATKLNNFKVDLTFTLKGATVEGNFNPEEVSAWFNYKFAPKGYAYMIPFSHMEANFVMAYPDYKENKSRDLKEMWESFFRQICSDIKQEVRITDQFEITRYICGICEKPKLENTYFVGNCFGTIMPTLGFGQFTSLLTGIYAAQDICGVSNYEETTEPLFDTYKNSLVLRKTLEQMNDDGFDMVFKSFNNKLLSELNKKVYGNDLKFDFLKYASYALRPYIKYKDLIHR